MKTIWTTDYKNNIVNAIQALSIYIEKMIFVRNHTQFSDEQLVTELVSCILGSQVRYEMAKEALDNLIYSGLLEKPKWLNISDDKFEKSVYGSLTGRCGKSPHHKSYRFPHVRAKQITNLRSCLIKYSLSNRLQDGSSLKNLRKSLVSDLPGVGPKQASLFLRNIGYCYDVAILDNHVMNFMRLQALLSPEKINIGSLPKYEKVESVIFDYSQKLGCRAGSLDLAIWATMKAASELNL